MAIAALVLWISTVAIGTYLLATASRIGKTHSAPPEPVPVSAGQTGAATAEDPPAKRAHVATKDDIFAPPSLGRELEALLPDIKFHWVKTAGHQVQTDQPEIVAEIVDNLIRRNPPVGA